MTLLVVGLVIVVLVILVVVFLTVRSNRNDAEDDYPFRSPGRERYEADPDGGRRHGPQSRPDRAQRPIRSGSGRDTWHDDPRSGYDDMEPATGDYEPVGAYRGRGAGAGGRDHAPGRPHRAAVPAPRSPADGAARAPRTAAPRGKTNGRPDRSVDAASSRSRRGGRGKADMDWPTDWGKVSDEQYWAELSSDKPLATTARSAQQGTASREPDRQYQETGHRQHQDDRGPVARSRPGQAAVAGDMPEPEAVAGAEGPDTDPGAAGPAHWSGSSDEAAPTASWGAADSAGPAWTPQEDQAQAWGQREEPADGWAPADASAGWTASDTADASTAAWTAPGSTDVPAAAWTTPSDWDSPAAPWSGPQPTAAAWSADDPLTSPSFAAQSLQATDSRSYRGSHQRAHSADDHPSGGYGYHPDPAWNSGAEAAAHAGGWQSGGDEYSGAPLEPLPELSSPSSAPAGDWYPAPAPADETAAYAYSQGDAYPASGQPHWSGDGQGYETGYGQDSYSGQGNGSTAYGQEAAYGQALNQNQDAAYGPATHYDHASYSQATSYDQPASYGQAASYRQEASLGQQPGQGYGQQAAQDYGPGTEHGLSPGQSGYDYGSVPSYASEAGYGAGSGEYGHEQPPGYEAGEQPYGQGPGYGHYPGYDGGRR